MFGPPDPPVRRVHKVPRAHEEIRALKGIAGLRAIPVCPVKMDETVAMAAMGVPVRTGKMAETSALGRKGRVGHRATKQGPRLCDACLLAHILRLRRRPFPLQ